MYLTRVAGIETSGLLPYGPPRRCILPALRECRCGCLARLCATQTRGRGMPRPYNAWEKFAVYLTRVAGIETEY